ncbi:Periplasmic aromatic aldehyde oxidoreductase, iron-sulfur subunit YagT [Enhygromyxa salina]|uniref:Periplasmic aromatic aldehyde oxidoreductase, iron-sulfur subunit YagT n=1 Tax=Enhygromyxa salina TaxID=215803 RepID=A0A0C1ZLP5_9BACT|nr:2Fe-2S iron-sulfur cluster-binding protein [Enhygromyxa salina]KIG18449.1 Periplasmic aromatic aldehyde oxidoreductase, iron-sulfur subunit YagT [Enhygromyxa salina]
MAKRDGPEHDETRGLTRRGLFRSIGAATLVAGCTKEDPPLHPESRAVADVDGAIGLTPTPLEFVLDGQPQKLEVEARTTLLDLLRLDLDRTGTKLVCDRGACGACMVMVDDVPRNSCMMLALDVAGATVTTVAGLGGSSQLSALQQAFVQHDALQCGFCTSGMLISSSALLRRSAGQTLERADVEDAIAGNLCRCGTYPHVVDAVLSVANGGGGSAHNVVLLRAKPSTKSGGA